LHGSWLVLIGNVQINFGVIWHFVLISELLELNTKVNVDYTVITLVFIVRKSVNYSVNLFFFVIKT